MSLSYASEKIGNAVWYLAAGTKPLQERLADVWVEHLIHVYPERDLTEDLRDRWYMIRALVSMDPNKDSGIGMVRDVIGEMSDDAAVEVVEGILEMQHYVEVAKREHGGAFPYFRLVDGEPHYDPPPMGDEA